MLSTDLAIFKAIYITNGSPPPPQTNYPYAITCGIGKKLVGNSASKPLKSTQVELP